MSRNNMTFGGFICTVLACVVGVGAAEKLHQRFGSDDSDSSSVESEHEHSWGDGIVVLEPTCETDGKMVYSCSCGENKVETIAAVGHSDANADLRCDGGCNQNVETMELIEKPFTRGKIADTWYRVYDIPMLNPLFAPSLYVNMVSDETILDGQYFRLVVGMGYIGIMDFDLSISNYTEDIRIFRNSDKGYTEIYIPVGTTISTPTSGEYPDCGSGTISADDEWSVETGYKSYVFELQEPPHECVDADGDFLCDTCSAITDILSYYGKEDNHTRTNAVAGESVAGNVYRIYFNGSDLDGDTSNGYDGWFTLGFSMSGNDQYYIKYERASALKNPYLEECVYSVEDDSVVTSRTLTSDLGYCLVKGSNLSNVGYVDFYFVPGTKIPFDIDGETVEFSVDDLTFKEIYATGMVKRLTLK